MGRAVGMGERGASHRDGHGAPVRLAFSYQVDGRGSTVAVRCDGPGTPYSDELATTERPQRPVLAASPDCGWTWHESSADTPDQKYAVSARVVYHVVWAVRGAAGGGGLGRVERPGHGLSGDGGRGPGPQHITALGNTAMVAAVALGMARATWNGILLAESDETVVVEGNHYFPANSVVEGVLQDSDTTSVCPWKGTASYKSVVVDGQVNADAAWYYPEPKDAAREIKDHLAFWKGVTVQA